MYKPDQWLYGEGDIETGIATVLCGSINVWISIDEESSRLLSIGGPTTIIGQSRVLGGGDRLVTVTAREESKVFTLGDSAIERIAARQPELWRSMGELLYKQLQNTVRVCALFALPSAQRIAHRLLELHRTIGTNNDGTISVDQYELADLSRVSRESLNAHLRKFEKNGWIVRGYMSILITDLQALQNFRE
jgi:CRP/FNR family cyclic AMP-dependent transcriptional regulator